MDKKYIGQGCYNIGNSPYGELYAELKNIGYNKFSIRIIVSPDRDNVHNKFREVGFISDIPDFNLTKDQTIFETAEAADEWLDNFAAKRGLSKIWV